MAYSDDIDALSPSHAYDLDGDANDRTAANNGTNSGGVFTGTPICEDVTNSWVTNGTTDRIVLPTATAINNSAQTRKAVAGWFMATAIQNPPKSIYGEGDTSTAFRFILGWGNALMFEVDSANFTLQVFGDIDLTANRAYHLCAVFEGNGYGNEFRCYLDGVEQLSANPTDRQPDFATLAARSAGEFGDPAGTVGVGGVEVIILAPINGQYNEWAMWDGANAVLTDTEIREELFEKGALPDVTISTGTEAAMQTALDAYADTVRGNAPLCIRIQDVTGGGNLALDADNITFNPLSSIHVQWMGTGTLTWTNNNGSDASIGSTPNGGTVVFLNPSQLTLTSLKNPTEVRVYEAGTENEVAGQESVTTGTFSATVGVASVDIQLVSLDYKIGRLEGVDTSSDISIDVVQFLDRVYENP